MPGSEPRGVVFNIMRFAVHDGPGLRTAVFLKGCPLDCWWCHNPESQRHQLEPMYFEERCRLCGECIDVCPQHAITAVDGTVQTDRLRCLRCGTCVETCDAAAREICGRTIGVDELVAEIERDLIFFDDSHGGVTLSGGEPLSQPRFVLAFLRACRERRIHTTLETCGYAHPLVFRMVAEAADLVLFDLKTLDRGKHRRYTGVFNDRILANLDCLAVTGRPMAVRIPVIPGINDSDAEARQFADYLAALRIKRVGLLPYHRIGKDKYKRLGLPCRLENLEPPEAGRLEQFAQPFRQAGMNVRIGG